jgi:DNA topoisomerase-1
VKHGKVNATLPSTSDPSNIALEEAVELLKARAEKQGIKQAKAKTPKKSAKKKAKEDGAGAPEGEAKPKKKAAKKKASKPKAAKKKAAAEAPETTPDVPDEAAE